MARYPRYAPEFSLRIQGEPLPGALRGSISSITYQDGLEGADRVEVTIANPGLRWLAHPLLQADNGFKLAIGYAPDPLEEVFVGEITGVEPSFPSGGMPTLQITAQDFLHRLTRGTKDRAFCVSIPSIDNFPLPDVVVAPGIVTVIILPEMPGPRPMPSPGLRRRVAAYLTPRRLIGTRVEVVGPTYLEVTVRTTVRACEGVSTTHCRIGSSRR